MLKVVKLILNLLNNNYNNNFRNPYIFKFKTNAKSFNINFSIVHGVTGNFPHVGVSLREGLTIMYKKMDEKTWLYVDLITSRPTNNHIYMGNYIKENIFYEVLIYGPILTKISNLTIEVSDQYIIKETPFVYDKNILIAGGLNSFGIGCTSAGYMFSNILSRKINAKVSHLTYNKVNYLKDIYKNIDNLDYKDKFDIGILELDYIAQDDLHVKKYLEDIVDLLYNKCKFLIGWFSIPVKEYKKENIYNILNYNILNERIIIVNINSIWNDLIDVCTYNYYFINDSANLVIYRVLEKIIKGNE